MYKLVQSLWGTVRRVPGIWKRVYHMTQPYCSCKVIQTKWNWHMRLIFTPRFTVLQYTIKILNQPWCPSIVEENMVHKHYGNLFNQKKNEIRPSPQSELIWPCRVLWFGLCRGESQDPFSLPSTHSHVVIITAGTLLHWIHTQELNPDFPNRFQGFNYLSQSQNSSTGTQRQIPGIIPKPKAHSKD